MKITPNQGGGGGEKRIIVHQIWARQHLCRATILSMMTVILMMTMAMAPTSAAPLLRPPIMG